MVKDIVLGALRMLGMTAEADALEADGETAAETAEYLRLYNLVAGEIADEYRRSGFAPAAALTDGEAEFYGISPRVLSYGVAAECCITRGLDEASMWDGRYKAALSLAPRPRATVRARRMYR